MNGDGDDTDDVDDDDGDNDEFTFDNGDGNCWGGDGEDVDDITSQLNTLNMHRALCIKKRRDGLIEISKLAFINQL